jgi:hypothetical protein
MQNKTAKFLLHNAIHKLPARGAALQYNDLTSDLLVNAISYALHNCEVPVLN